MRRDRSRRLWATAVTVLLLAVPAYAAGFRAPLRRGGARAAAAHAPRLGSAYSPAVSGFGDVRPTKIFLGGDPTGLVRDIHWSGWESSQAIGHGDAEYDWPGTAVADNAITSGARVVAFHLGTCRGHRSYNALEWYFPRYGQLFNPHRYVNACTGDVVGTPSVRSCPDVRLMDGTGMATLVDVSAMSCETASRLIAEAPAAQYLPAGGRFIQSGFRCGTMGAASGPPFFSCEKGPLEFSYTIEP